MKLKHKIYISACGFIVLQIFFLTFFVLAPIASAEFTIKTPAGKEITLEEAKINIPFESLSNEMKVTSDDIQPCEDGGDTLCLRIPWVAKYIGALYRYGVIFGSILAVVMIMIGGILYLIGGMNQTMISKGKGYIVGAVTGLILLLGSYVLLNTINPRLINLQPIKVEIAKEQKADQVKFCNELKVADYNFDPPLNQLRCGDESNYSLKDSDIVHEGTCIGDVCSNPKEWCMPKDRKDSGDYTCREVAIWGYFHEDGGRFLDCLWVNSLEGFSDPDNKNKDSSYEKGDKVYWVTKKELELSSTKHYYVLRVELNDTGMTRAKVTNSDIVKYGQAVATWVGIPGTFDDEYYLAIDPKTMKQDGQGRTIAEAIWMEPCKNATVVRYRKEGEKNAWMSEADQQERLYKRIDDFYLSGKGLRLDIYADRTVEDSDVSCLVANLLAPARKAVGEEW